MRKTAEQLSWSVLFKYAEREGNPTLWRKMINIVARSQGFNPPTDAEFAEIFTPDWQSRHPHIEDAINNSAWYQRSREANRSAPGGTKERPRSKPREPVTPEQEAANRAYDAEQAKSRNAEQAKSRSSRAKADPYGDPGWSNYDPYSSRGKSRSGAGSGYYGAGYGAGAGAGYGARTGPAYGSGPAADPFGAWNSWNDRYHNTQREEERARAAADAAEKNRRAEADYAEQKRRSDEWRAENARRAEEHRRQRDAEYAATREQGVRRDAAYGQSRAHRSKMWAARDAAVQHGIVAPLVWGGMGLASGASTEDPATRYGVMGTTGAFAGAHAGYGLGENINAGRMSNASVDVPFHVPAGFEAVKPYSRFNSGLASGVGGVLGLGTGLGVSHLIQKYYDKKKKNNPMKKAASVIAVNVLTI